MWNKTVTSDEYERLERLHALGVLDSEPEPLFDHLTALAAQICGTPVALLGLMDEHRQWVKSSVGMARGDTPRDDTFSNHTLQGEGVLEVPDAELDPRFAHLPSVQAQPALRFYAGVPICLEDGTHPGTLCVVDYRPRVLSEAQRTALTHLAGAAAQALMLRQQAQANGLPSALQAALAAQRESDRRFRVLAESSPLGVYQTTAAGACVYVNPAWQRIYGLTLEESLGEGWGSTLHPADAPEVLANWQRCAAAREPFEMTFRIRQPAAVGGRERHVLSRARAVEDEDGHPLGFVGVVEDITERLAAERRLRESEALLDRTGRLAGVGGWSLDLRSQTLVWSDQTCRIHDLEPGHQPSLAEAFEFYPLQIREVIEEAVQRCITDGEPWDLELPMLTAKGRAIWVRAQGQADWLDGEPVRLVGAVQDVTENHRAALELEHNRQRLRALYESTPALMYSVDPEGRLLHVSDRWLDWLGYEREQVIGRTVDDLTPPASADLLQREIRPALWRNGYLDEQQIQMFSANGSVRDVLISVVAELDAVGQPYRALAVAKDITEDLQRRAELAREQLLRRQVEQHALELGQLLKERSEMLDVLAHEVRQPLNNASAALQSAALSLVGRGEQLVHDRLTRAQAVLGQVLAGVDNTLAAASLLAEGSHIARLDTDIDTLIAVCVADLARDQRGRVVVQRHTATRTALMDMSLMRLALRNLLSNALRHAPGMSPVVLHVVDVDVPLALQFEIEDAGPGIPPALLPRLFTRGARGGGAESAHGLGLYIVRRVLDLHGGSAELLRTGPHGTVMRLTLPQAD